MAEWLVEEGIGEHRAIHLDRGRIVAARIDWPGTLAAGHVEDAILVSRRAGSTTGTALFANREEALVKRLPPSAAEGAPIRLEITRAAMVEQGRKKLAQAQPTDRPPAPAHSLAQRLRGEGHAASVVRRFPVSGWSELWLEAWHGTVEFAGGTLTLYPTPAMVLIDIDGVGATRQLALAAVAPLADAIHRLDLAGSIGIDFPTLPAKSDRKAVDEALSEALADWNHERTAMNGFGFVQLVARLERISLLHRIVLGRTEAAARLLLRDAESVEAPGALLLTAHPDVKARLKQVWLDELARRTGRQVRLAADAALALEGGFAQAVPL